MVIALAMILAAATGGGFDEADSFGAFNQDPHPCGVPGAKQLLAYQAYADKSSHIIEVTQHLTIEVHREGVGPIVVSDATSGELLLSIPPAEFDGFVAFENGSFPQSDAAVIKVPVDGGTLMIDPAFTLSRHGAYVFMCWLPSSQAPAGSAHYEEVYSRVERVASGELVLRRRDGSTLLLPVFRAQVDAEDVRVSDDGRRIGWLVDLPNVGDYFPGLLVIFKGGRIEQVIQVGQAIFAWAFARHGSAVAFWHGTLHFSNARAYELLDIRTKRSLAFYGYPESTFDDPKSEKARADAITGAPAWVKALPGGTD
jgi:hypothetical protein